MAGKNDVQLLSGAAYLKKAYINPTDGEEICKCAPHLKHCRFCLEPVKNNMYQYWFVPVDLSCCICEECYNDFKEDFEWKQLDGWDIDWELSNYINKEEGCEMSEAARNTKEGFPQ